MCSKIDCAQPLPYCGYDLCIWTIAFAATKLDKKSSLYGFFIYICRPKRIKKTLTIDFKRFKRLKDRREEYVLDT